VGGVTASQHDVLPDNELRSRANPSKDELRELGQELREHGVSERTRLLLAKLASYPPNIRLAINLKIVVGLLINGPIYSVLREGLTPDERAALVELDMRGLSIRARETAHGLLNVHERWFTLKRVRSMFRDAVAAADEFLLPKDQQAEEEEKET